MKEITLIGASWCNPCKQLKKQLDSFGIQYNYLDIDNETTKELAKTLNIRTVPAVILKQKYQQLVITNNCLQAVLKFNKTE